MKRKDALDLNDLFTRSVSPIVMKELLDLVAQNSLWAPPRVYQRVQVVYPRTRRKHAKEKKGSVDDRGVRLWTNEPPIRAFWMACGKRPKQVKSANICHLYEGSVHDPAHYTNLANLTALPKSLASLSEWEPINSVLKYHSFKMYKYRGPKELEPLKLDYYPPRWAIHQSELSSEHLEKIVKQLEHQSKDQPQYSQYRKEEEEGLPRVNTETLDDPSDRTRGLEFDEEEDLLDVKETRNSRDALAGMRTIANRRQSLRGLGTRGVFV